MTCPPRQTRGVGVTAWQMSVLVQPLAGAEGGDKRRTPLTCDRPGTGEQSAKDPLTKEWQSLSRFNGDQQTHSTRPNALHKHHHVSITRVRHKGLPDEIAIQDSNACFTRGSGVLCTPM